MKQCFRASFPRKRFKYFLRLSFYVFSFLGLLRVIFLLIQSQRSNIPSKVSISTRNIKPNNSSIPGSLNVHVWQLACNFNFEDFLEYPIFPAAPQLQIFTDTLDKSTENLHGKSLGERIFGYLLAPITGNFRFALSSGGSAELWLSKDINWQNVQLICNLRTNTTRSYSHTVSSDVFLESSSFYFIEILHVQKTFDNHSLEVKWKTPHSENFEKIQEIHLFSFTQKQLILSKMIQEIPLTRSAQKNNAKYEKHSSIKTTKSLITNAKYLHLSEVYLALPSCPYQPGYVGKRVVYQYQTVEKFVNPSYVYPEIKHAEIKDGKWIPWFPLDAKIAEYVVQEYVKKLQMAYPGKYHLKTILNVEQKPNWHHMNTVFYKGNRKHGDRYFLELELWDEEKHENVVLSEYIYRHSSNSNLCYPKGMHWNKTAPVYLLLSSRKLGEWLWHFIQNIEHIYLVTKDENLHVVIYDYNTTTINVETKLRESSFKNYKVLKGKDEKYSRTYSLNRAAEAVSDPHAIVFTLDLHLEIPSSFANNVRKHCVEGKMFYTPIICRLKCGASPKEPSGSWDPWGYGMFGVYKSDWDRFKGFDEEKYKKKWGGEDWDIVERAYKVGLEFERIKHPDLYHYFHSKKGMWK